MKNENRYKIIKIHSNLQKKYKVGPKKLNFSEDLFEQLVELLDRIKKTVTKKIEENDDDDSSYVEKMLPLDLSSENSDEDEISESDDYISDTSSETKHADQIDDSTESDSEKPTDTDFKNINFESSADVLAALEKPVKTDFEMEDELESDYLENLNDSE